MTNSITLGHRRDFDLFLDFKENKKENIDECSFFLCTGLFDKYDQDLNYYKELLNSLYFKKNDLHKSRLDG